MSRYHVCVPTDKALALLKSGENIFTGTIEEARKDFLEAHLERKMFYTGCNNTDEKGRCKGHSYENSDTKPTNEKCDACIYTPGGIIKLDDLGCCAQCHRVVVKDYHRVKIESAKDIHIEKTKDRKNKKITVSITFNPGTDSQYELGRDILRSTMKDIYDFITSKHKDNTFEYFIEGANIKP